MKKLRKSIIELIKIPKITDDGFLCFAQNPAQIPFPIKRVYYIFEAVPDLTRGKHAHYKNRQVLFCIQGSITMVLDNGRQREEVMLNQPEIGIVLDKMIWHEMHNFKKDTIILVLASRVYEAEDYIRDYNFFLEIIDQ